MPALRKPLVELERADFEGLIREEWREDELLEFKRTLATSKGDPDRWIKDQSDIGASAKRDVLAEVVAMANSYGGDVILGLDEAADKPSRASALMPLPRCVELAHRLELAARDLIKPEIPMLGVRGVPIEGESGLVIFRAPRSRAAPHRLEMRGMEKECYKRVSDRTEAMTMREIRDLAFSVASGLDAVNRRLAELRSEFHHWANTKPVRGPGVRRLAYRISAAPLSADLFMERVHGNEEVKPVSRATKVMVNNRAQDFQPLGDPYQWRPILRGTQAEQVIENAAGRLVRLSCDGVLQDLTFKCAVAEDTAERRLDFVLFPGWYFGTVLNVMRATDRFRRAVGAQAVQYALDVEIQTNAPLPVMGLGGWQEISGTLAEGAYSFPQYQVGEPDSWTDLLNVMWCDFWHLIGVDATRGEIALVR